MTERPILFSGPMVRSILEGRKTQTRRIIKNQPPADVAPITVSRYQPTVIDRYGDEAPGEEIFGAYSDDGTWGCKSPYGASGDRLRVREAWRSISELDAHSGARIAEMCIDAGYTKPWAPIQYEADGQRANWEHTSTPPHDGEPRAGRYRHARFLPLWATRITLQITDIRVERLLAISETDAIAEGVTIEDRHMEGYCCGAERPPGIRAFRDLWTSINGPESWEANPFVWVVTFRRIS